MAGVISSNVPLTPGSPLFAAIDAYRTCELLTLGKDGTPVAWPTSCLPRADGTILVTTSLGFPQKAFNVRRDPRVAVLFSDPTASALTEPEQILITGTATCPDEVHTEPTGDLATLWARLFERQPKCRGYLDWPATTMTDFYFMRLLVTITPAHVSTRPLPAPTGTGAGLAGSGLTGADVLAAYPTAVLATRDTSGAPLLVRTTVTAGQDGYRVAIPDDVPAAAGPAGLLVHRHDHQLSGLHNANVRGLLEHRDGEWTLRPDRLVEPTTRHPARLSDNLRTVRSCRAATARYLRRRGLPRPRIPWAAYRAIRSTVPS